MPSASCARVRLSAADAAKYEVGQTLTASDLFSTGDKVDVTGTSKGRGFAGVMKRHNFAGFIRSHGTHEFFRHGGSIGTRLTPGHVLKGKKMPGHMGSKRVTVQNLALVKVDDERNLVYLRGGVPGPNGALVHRAQGRRRPESGAVGSKSRDPPAGSTTAAQVGRRRGFGHPRSRAPAEPGRASVHRQLHQVVGDHELRLGARPHLLDGDVLGDLRRA